MAKRALGKGLKELGLGRIGKKERKEHKKPRNIEHKRIREELAEMIDHYREDGIVVSGLERALPRSVDQMKRAMDEFRDGLVKLEEVKNLLMGMDLSSEVMESIRERLHDPINASKLYDEVSSLGDRTSGVPEGEKDEKMNEWMEEQKKMMIDLVGMLKGQEGGPGTTPDGSEAVPAPEAGEELSPEPAIQHDAGQVQKGAPEDSGGTMIGDKISALKKKMEGMRLEGTPAPDDAPEQDRDDPRSLLIRQLEEWKRKGYLISRLEMLIDNDLEKAGEEFKAFAADVEKIGVLKERLEGLDTDGFESKVRLIQTKLNYPNLATEIEKEIERLYKKICQKKGIEYTPFDEILPAPTSSEPPVEAAPEVRPVEEEEVVELEPMVAGEVSEEPTDAIPEAIPVTGEEESAGEEGSMDDVVELEPLKGDPAEGSDEPTDLPALLEEAQKAYRNKDFQRAVALFDRVLALDTENSNAIFLKRRAMSRIN